MISAELSLIGERTHGPMEKQSMSLKMRGGNYSAPLNVKTREKMTHEVQIIALPVKHQENQVREGHLFINDATKHSWGKRELLKCERVTVNGHAWNGTGIKTYINQVYMTISQAIRPIKVGDWYLEAVMGSYLLHQMTQKSYDGWYSSDDKIDNFKRRCKKVIATTDLELLDQGINELSQEALKKFFDTSSDTKWEIEYKKERRDACTEFGLACNFEYCTCGESYIFVLNKDNTIDISEIFVKLYTREEVEKIVKRAYNDFRTRHKGAMSIVAGGNAVGGKRKYKITDVHEWIKNNLA